MPTDGRRRVWPVVVTAIVILLGGAVFAVLWLSSLLNREPAPWASSCTATVDTTTVRVSPEQARNAAIIAGVASRRGLAPRAVSIALATAMQESGLRNLDYGDRDSLGLFQQRPSQGWGSKSEVMDPWYSANAFYAAMEKVDKWQTADIGDIAQEVQRSGFPDAYDKHVPDARILASALSGETPAAFSCSLATLPAGDPASLKTFLGKTLPKGSAIDASASTVTIKATSATNAWSAAAISIAVASTEGVASAGVADETWRHLYPPGDAWTATQTEGATKTRVVVSMAS